MVGVQPNRSDQVDVVVLASGEDGGGGDVSAVHHVFSRCQLPDRHPLVDRRGDLGVVDGGVGGFHVRDQMRGLGLAGPAGVNLVAAPARPALDAVVGIAVIRRGQPLSGWREVLALPPAHPLRVPVVLLGPGPAQDPDRGDLAQPGRSKRVIDGIQEREPVPAHLLGPLQAGVVSLRESVVVDLGPVAVHPRRVDQRGQPVRDGRGQRFQCRPQRLADELHAVQCAHRGQHLCGIGPLPAPGLQHSRVGQPGQNHVQDPFLQPMREKPGPEVSQDGEVEPRIIQLQAQQELPVHTSPYLVSGLPVGKTLRILQHRHRGQSPRRDRGPSLPGEGHREVIVPEHRTEHFPDSDRQSPLEERGPHHTSRQLRHPFIRPRLQRHPVTPVPPTTIAISQTNDAAPLESRLPQRSRERQGFLQASR